MHAIDDIELVTYSVETQKDENENILEVATTAFSGHEVFRRDRTDVHVRRSSTAAEQLKLERDSSHPSLLFTEDTSEGNSDEAVEILETSWKPLVSPADADWLKSEWTEEEEWLNSLQLPKEWLASSYRSRSNTPTSSPVSIRRRKPRQKSGLAETERAGPQKTETGWYLLRSHHRALVAREVSMTLNNRNQSGFTSYIDLEPPPDQKEPEMETTPDLLPGEMVISQADRVCIYSTHSGGMTSGQTGALFVTTLKLSFKLHVEKETGRQNKLLGEMDIPLSSIQYVYEILGEAGEKRKKLPLGSNVSNKIDGIFVMCKNFRFLRFSFKFSGVDAGRNITNALLHHSRPKKNELLFAFEHSLNQRLDNKHTTDWENIRKESECPNTRVSRANETWQVSISLPQHFVVPAHVTDEALSLVAGPCLGTRPPVWVWGNKIGGSLFIQPVLNVTPSASVDQMLEDFFRSRKKFTIDLDQSLPSQAQLEESFTSMLELHCIDGEKEAEEKDKSYFSSLESSGWLSFVGSALKLASQVADYLSHGKTVVLMEGEGRSTSILVSSLAQLLVSDQFRTRVGFEALIQSNWVSLGFQFSKNHTLSNLSSKVMNLNPTFLLFLDCVHQLCQQFPSKLEFLPQYLIALWDTTLLPVFDTFIFDSEHDRAVAKSSPDTPLQLHSAWDWGQQFNPVQISKWNNPLYGVPLRPPRSSTVDPSDMSMIMGRQQTPAYPESKKFLPVSGDVVNLSVWYQLFHRSVPFLSATNSWTERLAELRMEAKSSVVTMMEATRPNINYKNNHKSSQLKNSR